jgi:hypothetical protein
MFDPHFEHQGWASRSCFERRCQAGPYRVRGRRVVGGVARWVEWSAQRGGWSVSWPQPRSIHITKRWNPTLSESCHTLGGWVLDHRSAPCRSWLVRSIVLVAWPEWNTRQLARRR